jgi:NAD-dependent deacetylase
MKIQDLTLAIQKLRTAQSVAVITGSGISAESGIPTFRGSDGLWSKFNIEDLATPEAFQRDPKRVWEWYIQRRQEYGDAQPNPAHYTIAEMETYYQDFLLITQNIDTLHSKAGSKKMLEIHGNIEKARCTKCHKIFDNVYTQLPETLVLCPDCGALARPHIVWFGELYDPDMIDQALMFLTSTDIVIIIGTSGVVPTPIYLACQAIRNGAYAIDINPEVSEISAYVELHIREKAGIALPKLWKSVVTNERTIFSCKFSPIE